MSGNNDSTLKSYIDSAVGTAQSALGSLTGNTGDKVGEYLVGLFLLLPASCRCRRRRSTTTTLIRAKKQLEILMKSRRGGVFFKKKKGTR